MTTQKQPKKINNPLSCVCTIRWPEQESMEWYDIYADMTRSNLLQSPIYGLAMAAHNRQNLRQGIIEIDGDVAGIFQILEARVLGHAIHGIWADRLPLWCDGYGTHAHFQAFMAAFTTAFPKRFGRRMRLLPEVASCDAVRAILQDYGYKQSKTHDYQTIIVDLRVEHDVLRNKMKKRWRYELRKSEKSAYETILCNEGQFFSWLMVNYARDQRKRGYHGASVKTLSALAAAFSRGKQMIIATACLDNAPIASILVFIHGKMATYQVAYATEEGREHRAHYGLLWSVMKRLKKDGIYEFDLGGVNDESAKGVKIFKEGMGGELIRLPGIYT